MSGIGKDFGGFAAFWRGDRGFIFRLAHGEPVPGEGLQLSPLNALQARKTLDALIEDGKRKGLITDEHVRQSWQMPAAPMAEQGPRSEVDRIAGPD